MEEVSSPARARLLLKSGGIPLVRPDVFVQLTAAEQADLLGRLPPLNASSLLRDSDSGTAVRGLLKFGIDRAASLLKEIPPDDLADLALHLPPESRDQMLAVLGEEQAAEVRQALSYPRESAGGLMSTRFASIPEVFSAAKAQETLREFARVETINYVYVVDPGGKLVGTLPVRALLSALPRQHVSDLVLRSIVKLNARMSRDEVVRVFREHHYLALPVTDDHDRLVGVITADDVLDAAQDQADQIVFSATGVDAREPLMVAAKAARSRIPWISMTILGGLGCAAVAWMFKHTLERLVVIGLFVPMVLAIAESVAAQTSTLVMRTIVMGEIVRQDLVRFMIKEVTIGIILGVYAGCLVGGLSLLWDSNGRIGIAIGVAIVVGTIWASVVAVVVPFFLTRMKVEPAVASGPLVLMLADLSTLVIYFVSVGLIT